MTENQYYVLFRRDVKTQKNFEEAKGREIYDSIKEIDDLLAAYCFVLDKQATQPILITNQPFNKKFENKIRYKNKPYVVAGYFPKKYKSHDYTGGFDYVPTHEILRTNENGLENAIKILNEEGADKIYVGIELKMQNLIQKNTEKICKRILNGIR